MKKFLASIKTWQFIVFALTIIIFFVLRLINLNGLPVFVDEAIYIRWAQVMKNEATLRFLPLQDGKQPLFMWSMIPMFKIIADPLLAGRILSIFAGLGSLLGLATLSILLFPSIEMGLLTAFLYAVTPYTVFFDRLALVDSFLAMFGVWSLVIGYLYVKKPSLDLSMILGIILGLGLLTKSPAIFFYLWQPLLILFIIKKSNSRTAFPYLKLLAGWFLAFIISQVIYNILRLGPNFHMVGSRNQDYLFSFSEILHHPLNPLINNLKSTFSWISTLFTLPITVLLFLSFSPVVKLQNKKYLKISLTVLAISLLPLTIQALFAKVYTPRYLYFAVLPLLIIIPLGALQLIKVHKILLLVLTIPLAISIKYILIPTRVNMPYRMRNGYLEEWTAGWGQKDFSQYAINLAKQGKKLVIGTEGYFGTLPEGLQIYTQGYPNITVIGVGQPIVDIPSALANTSRDNLIFLVVNRSRNKLPPNALQQLQLLKTYIKPQQTDGTQEALQVYQLIK